MRHIKLMRAIGALVCSAALTVHAQSQKPAELKIGITTFLSGSASVFGVPAKAAAEQWIEEFNAAGGINGTKLAPVYIDEGLGGDKLLSEYRRLVQDQGIKVMLASISSGNCNIVAPVAEDLKVLNIMWDCSTQKILEEHRYKYVFRTTSQSAQQIIAATIHLLRTKPDFKTVAIVNPDYASGRDAWELFRGALTALKPDVKFVAEMFPKLGASDYSTEITRLAALKPDIIFSNMWGGDAATFVRQASQRGLFKNSQFVMPLFESSLQLLGNTVPDGVLVGMQGDVYFADPEFQNDPKVKAFVEKFRAKTGAYPIYPVGHITQALQAMVDAHAKAIKDNGGQWPSTEQVASAMRSLEYRSLSRPIRMREDGQAMQGSLLGVTKMTPQHPFPVIDQLTYIPAEMVTAPLGQKSTDWVKTLKPDLLQSPQIKMINAR